MKGTVQTFYSDGIVFYQTFLTFNEIILKSLMSLIHDSRDSNEYCRYGYVTKVKKSTIVVKYSKGKYKEEGIKHFTYAIFNVNIPLKNMFKEYRKRFKIESSYRLINQARTHTSTKNQN
jgi:hypothetical protein